jgi:BirA family biotin operon repressor/biotin-[acetyl-CoA-carboxylase] ligase
MGPIDKLDPDRIRPATNRIGSNIIVYQSTSSTNDIAAQYARDSANNGLAIFAEEQTAGRGRSANKWLSPAYKSILCSVLLTDSAIDAELLCLTCAVAVADAVGPAAKIKWPNDIILGGRKVAGILLESKSINDSNCFIIGIGINCHQEEKDFPIVFQDSATSLDIETASVCDRNVVAKRLLASVEHWLSRAEKSSKKVIKKWTKLSTLLNQRITVIYNDKEFTGTCTGIDPQKGLILQLDTGGIRFFDAAHTSIAK